MSHVLPSDSSAIPPPSVITELLASTSSLLTVLYSTRLILHCIFRSQKYPLVQAKRQGPGIPLMRLNFCAVPPTFPPPSLPRHVSHSTTTPVFSVPFPSPPHLPLPISVNFPLYTYIAPLTSLASLLFILRSQRPLRTTPTGYSHYQSLPTWS